MSTDSGDVSPVAYDKPSVLDALDDVYLTKEEVVLDTGKSDLTEIGKVDGSDSSSVHSHAVNVGVEDTIDTDHTSNPLKFIYNYIVHRDINIHILGFGIAILNIGFTPIQSFATIRYPDIGSYLLALIYATYGTNSFMAPFYIELVGPAVCVPISFCFMLVLPLTLLQSTNAGVMLGALSQGFGQGLFYCSAGRIITSVSTNIDEGSNAGWFQTYSHAGTAVGGLVYAVMNMPSSTFNSTSQWHSQYIIFACCEILAILIALMLVFTYRRGMKRKAEVMTAATRKQVQQLREAGQTEDALRLEQSLVQHRIDIRATLGRIKQNIVQCIRLVFTKEYLPIAATQVVGVGLINAFFSANFNSALAGLSIGHDTVGVSWLGWMGLIDQVFAMTASTACGYLMQWAGRSFHINRSRVKYSMYVGIFFETIFMGLAILCAHIYTNKLIGNGAGQWSWNSYFALIFFSCFCMQWGYMHTELTYYFANQVWFGPVSVCCTGLAFGAKTWVEAVGWVIGFLINPHLSTPYQRTVVWPVILLSTWIPASLYYIICWQPPEQFTEFDVIREKFIPQLYRLEGEATSVAKREVVADRQKQQLDAQQQSHSIDAV